ncbi:MAG: LlsX family protein [Epulopiscium sp.]|nr:LlsX family protein [Candidatus Epulonipiscium sp.]
MKRRTKVIIALVIGFAVAMILMSIAIYFGYTKAYNSGVESHVVKLFGIPIYELTKTGSEYSGTTLGAYMGLVCGIFMVLSLAIEASINKVRTK